MSGHVCGCHTGGPLPSRGWGRVLPGPHSAQDAPRDDAAQCLPCRGGGPAESQEAPASMWGLRGSGRATGTCPGPGAAAKPGCAVGTRPDTGPSSPPSRRRHRPRGTRDGRAPGGRGRDAGPPPSDIGAALGRTQGPGRGAWRRRAALRAPSPGRGRATPPTATQRPWGRFRRENAGCRSPRPGVLVPLGEGRGDRVRGGGLRGAEAEEAE